MKTKREFTKGPWVSTKYGYGKYSVNGHNGVEICSAWNLSNTRLIESAPDLYEELDRIHKLIAEFAVSGFTDEEIGEKIFTSQGDRSKVLRKVRGDLV